MTINQTELTWTDAMKFDALQNGKIVKIDGGGDDGKSGGVKPKALILSALAGCTGADVASMLDKMRVPFSDLKIKAVGELTEEHPKTYHTIHLTYLIKLQNPKDKDKMKKAVKLSHDKYCGVSAMVRKFAELKMKIEYL